MSGNLALLPVYHKTSRARYNVNRDGPYILMTDDNDSDHSLCRTSSEISLSTYLPDYAKNQVDVDPVKPLVPNVQHSSSSTPDAQVTTKKHDKDLLEKGLIWFDLYRKLFAICMIFNTGALIAASKGKFDYAKKNMFSIALGNLLVSILVRNELALRIVYFVVVKTLYWTPIRIRNMVTAFMVNLGGIHSGCSSAGLMWSCYAASHSFRSGHLPHAVLAFAVMTPIALGISTLVALPYIRHNHHNAFEQLHRFVGWLGLIYLWILVILLTSWDEQANHYRPGRVRWYEKQEFWYTLALSIMIIAPWLTLCRIPVMVSSPSPKTAFLSFPGGCYTGLIGRLSRSPWLEWHAFGIISTGPLSFTHHMLVVAQGDWTKRLITDPPEFVWTRGLKFAGLPYLAEMYQRGIIVATGAGIGVTLSVYLQTQGHFHLIWIGSDIERTYGAEVMTLLRQAVKGDRMTLVDTKKVGRPDTVQLIDDAYRKIDAQVVFITSNPKGTELIVNGCRERGLVAFGPLFDS